MAESWMRVVIYRSPVADDTVGAEHLKSSTRAALRLLECQPGFKLGYWGHNPKDGEMAAVTYWDSLQAIRAAGAVLEELQAERARFGISIASVRNMRLSALPVGPIWREQPPADS